MVCELCAQSNFSATRIREAIENHILAKNTSIVEIDFLQRVPDYNFDESGIHAEIDCELNDCGVSKIFLKFLNRDRVIRFSEFSIRTKQRIQVYTTNRTIGTGQTLSMGDLTITNIVTDWKCPDYIVNVNEINGRSASRNITRGTVLTKDMIAADVTIRRGDRVSITAISGAVRIRTMGTALQDASTGQQIRLKRDNGGTLTGIVGEDGAVYIDSNSLSQR